MCQTNTIIVASQKSERSCFSGIYFASSYWIYRRFSVGIWNCTYILLSYQFVTNRTYLPKIYFSIQLDINNLVFTWLPFRSTRVHLQFLVGFMLLDIQFYVYVLQMLFALLYFFFWSIVCLFFFDIRILITPFLFYLKYISLSIFISKERIYLKFTYSRC